MHIYLSQYDTAATRAAAIDGAAGDVLAVELIETPAVLSAPALDGSQIVEVPAVLRPGYWLLTASAGDMWGAADVVAEIDPDTGAAIRWTDAGIAGAVISPKWAGMADGGIALEAAEAEASGLPAITARQLRLTLLAHGLLADVEAAAGALPAAAQIEWEYATEYQRDHPLIAQLGAALGLTAAQIDGMWAEALGV